MAPIFEEGQQFINVYLPAGTWKHLWTDSVYTGPTRATVFAPVGKPAVFFDSISNPRFLTDRKMLRHEPGSKTLVSLLGGSPDATMVSFLEACLQWNPEERMTPADALRHPFITGALGSFERSLSGALPVLTTAYPPKRASVVSISSFSSLNTSLANSGADLRTKQATVLLPPISKPSS